MEAAKETKEAAPVIIVGGGPTGLSLALGLAECKVRSVLVEKNNKTSDTSKAPGVHVRTREIFRQWGIEDEIIRAGNLEEKVSIHRSGTNEELFSVDFTELDREVNKPGILILEQAETERILLEAVKKTNLCEIRFGTEAIALKNEGRRIRVTVRSKRNVQNLYSKYLIGCDGAGSFVRHALQLPFEGMTYSIRAILADIRIQDHRDELSWPRFHNGKDISVGLRLKPGLWRLIRLESGGARDAREVSRSEVNERVKEILGPGDFELEWASPFKIHRRSSPRFRVDRILLAGDAAHVHSPVGGQGMNAGIQDSHNLAWKLATCVTRENHDLLLDSYESEREAVVVKKVFRYTDLVTRVFLQSPQVVRSASFFLLRRILNIKKLRKRFLRRTTMINLDYPDRKIGKSKNKTIGKRLPNVRLHSVGAKPVRLYELLPYRWIIISIGANKPERLKLPVVHIGPGAYSEPFGILQNFIGERKGYILIRPDAHIAWTGVNIGEMQKVCAAYQMELYL